MNSIGEYERNLASLMLEQVDFQRSLMTAVATGGPRIDDVNLEYKNRRTVIGDGLPKLGLADPNPYTDLWSWYGKWSADLPNYRSRREYLRDLYAPLQTQLESVVRGNQPADSREPTGWERVDRALDKLRLQLQDARDEEDYQQVGLLAREVLISLGQAVYDPSVHPPVDDVTPGQNDAGRMLESYIAATLAGKSNEELRRHAKAALRLALSLQHERDAGFRKAALCAEATASVVNTIAIISGRRDPPN